MPLYCLFYFNFSVYFHDIRKNTKEQRSFNILFIVLLEYYYVCLIAGYQQHKLNTLHRTMNKEGKVH
jgi:hypothetical protein